MSGSQVRNSKAMEVAARLGLGARGMIYLLIGVLTLVLAFGRSRPETDQRGALQALTAHPGGAALVFVIAVGLAGYALWRLTEAAVGTAGEGKQTGPRLRSLARGVLYTVLAVVAFEVVAGRHSSQAAQSSGMSARLMAHSGGRLLLGAIGVVVAVSGLVLAGEGLRRSFAKYLRLGGLGAPARRIVIALGVVGTVARGALFALAGILVVEAAVRYQPTKASGVDAAIRTLAEQPFGRVLLVVTGVGLLAFGGYGFAEARWRIT